jgi:hypothetical protein
VTLIILELIVTLIIITDDDSGSVENSQWIKLGHWIYSLYF